MPGDPVNGTGSPAESTSFTLGSSIQNRVNPSDEMLSVYFHYPARRGTKSISVAGSFNEWSQSALPMKQNEVTGTWEADTTIAPGVYHYRFVINGDIWVCDPAMPRSHDANGNPNTKLVVEPLVYLGKPGKKGDGQITHEAIAHDPKPPFVVRRSETEWVFEIQCRSGDVERVFWVSGSRRVKLKRKLGDDLYETWRCSIRCDEPPTKYAFLFEDGDARHQTQDFEIDPARFPLLRIPDWVKGRVFYQIFPDRFETSHQPRGYSWDMHTWNRVFMGGNLAGVRQRWDYLVDLGVGGVYFTPIFDAKSYHAYDTYDYERIHPNFGTNEEFGSLVKEAHDRGIKVMLDAVFNHSGTGFFAFKDLCEKGADSAYIDWYFDVKHPVDPQSPEPSYRGWSGVRHMPKLNQDNPACREYFLKIGRKWIEEAGIDGWRLDVANEVSEDFWKAFKREVRDADPECYILGEHWHDARPWLQGDQWDSTMNYRWHRATLDLLLRRMSPRAYVKALHQIEDDYPEGAIHGLFNLLGSHDTMRVATVLKDPRKVDLAFALLLTYPGVPCIYYGDEVGMEGWHDPDCRKCMDWSEATWNRGRLALIKALIRERNQSEALRVGDVKMEVSAPGILTLLRTSGSEVLTLIANVSQKASPIELPAGDLSLSNGWTAGTRALEPWGFVLVRNSGQ